MAEAVSFVASIITLIDITAKLCKLGSSYLGGVNSAKTERSQLINEIRGFLVVLHQLRDVAEQPKPPPSLQLLHNLTPAVAPSSTAASSSAEKQGILEQCHADLEGLLRQLQPSLRFKGAWDSLKWPLKEGDTNKILARIARYQTLFSLAINSNHIVLSQEIASNVDTVNATTQRIELRVESIETKIDSIDQRMQQKERKHVEAWLSPLEFWMKQKDTHARHQENTGLWVLEEPLFKDWVEGKCNTLWCPGIPGAGKTVIASIIINHLENLPISGVGIAYIYCDYKDERHNAVNLVSSVLKHLVASQPVLPRDIMAAYVKQSPRGARPTLTEYTAMLQTHAARYQRIFMVVDGLDECTEDDGTRGVLISELLKMHSNLSLLITSRHIDVADMLPECSRLEIVAQDDDIKAYIEGRLRHPSMARLSKSCVGGLKDELRNVIVQKSNGMFLLAQLHLDSLIGQYNRALIKKALQRLPPSLDSVYQDTMSRISRMDDVVKDLALRILAWIANAVRPLTVSELQHALAVSPESVDLVEPDVLDDIDPDTITEEEWLVSVCAGLVTIDRESRIIRLVHYTVQEYFDRFKTNWFPGVDVAITRSCVLYLSLKALLNHITGSRGRNMEELIEMYSLLEYAAKNWAHHAVQCPEEEVADMVVELLRVRPRAMVLSSVIFPLKGYSAVHIAVAFNFTACIDGLLANGVEPDEKDQEDRTPLSHAAETGKLDIVNLLLKSNKVNVNARARCNSHPTPLMYAATNVHQDVVEALLAHQDTDINFEDSNGATALTYLGRARTMPLETDDRRLAMFRRILDGPETKARLVHSSPNDGANSVTRRTSSSTTHSHTDSSKQRHQAICERFLAQLEIKADPKCHSGPRDTPLLSAASNGHLRMVETLLARQDVDRHAIDELGRTALILAVISGDAHIVKSVLLSGINIEAEDYYGRTALSYAAELGYFPEVELLLMHGANAEAKSSSYGPSQDPPYFHTMHRSAFSYAAGNGHLNVAKLLLEHGADLDSRALDGRSPLSYASEYGHVEVVEMLIALGADPDSKTNNKADNPPDEGRTPLSYAAASGALDVVKVLLAHDVDVNSTNITGKPPISYAAEFAYTADGNNALVVLELLTVEGVDPELRCKDRKTPLFYGYRSPTVVKALLARGADPEATDSKGKTPLSQAELRVDKTIYEIMVTERDKRTQSVQS